MESYIFFLNLIQINFMIAYITGTSSGIGKAIALKLLKEGYKVVGLSRSCSISELNYSHISLDLSDLNAISKFEFSPNNTEDVILINNAGMIGPIKPIGHHVEQDIIQINTVNVIAPQLLSNKFINKFIHLNHNYQIINVSSGAGKNAIDAWSTYCASKASIDLFSETIALELTGRNHNNWNIFSIAPGVVDTKMQNEIRESNPANFLSHQKFMDLNSNDELSNPVHTADLFYKVISRPNEYKSVVFSVRDIV
jgi:benzil reductase ((S)-benzoin forming)